MKCVVYPSGNPPQPTPEVSHAVDFALRQVANCLLSVRPAYIAKLPAGGGRGSSGAGVGAGGGGVGALSSAADSQVLPWKYLTMAACASCFVT